MADAFEWDFDKAARSFGITLLGGLTESSGEVPGYAPNPIGTQPTGYTTTGQPLNDEMKKDSTLLYVGGGLVVLLVLVLIVLAVKGK